MELNRQLWCQQDSQWGTLVWCTGEFPELGKPQRVLRELPGAHSSLNSGWRVLGRARTIGGQECRHVFKKPIGSASNQEYHEQGGQRERDTSARAWHGSLHGSLQERVCKKVGVALLA